MESRTKEKITTYQNCKTDNKFEKTKSGSLASKRLNDIVKREHVVLGSEYLTTLFVAVPRHLEKEWMANYESLTELVVPQSSQKIATDSEFTLYSVTLFKRVVEAFTEKAKLEKFIVRDFVYDPQTSDSQVQEVKQKDAQRNHVWASSVRWARRYLEEAFIYWFQLKVIFVIIEATLNYGLPPRFQCFLVSPVSSKQLKKTRASLLAVFDHLKSPNFDSHSSGGLEEGVDSVAFAGSAEYLPYTSLTISVNFHL
ncbi:V-type proton ATPase subunit C-like [Zophobas morio]